jgi:hypothetical protein
MIGGNNESKIKSELVIKCLCNGRRISNLIIIEQPRVSYDISRSKYSGIVESNGSIDAYWSIIKIGLRQRMHSYRFCFWVDAPFIWCSGKRNGKIASPEIVEMRRVSHTICNSITKAPCPCTEVSICGGWHVSKCYLLVGTACYKIKIGIECGVHFHQHRGGIWTGWARIHDQGNLINSGIRVGVRWFKPNGSIGICSRVSKIPSKVNTVPAIIFHLHIQVFTVIFKNSGGATCSSSGCIYHRNDRHYIHLAIGDVKLEVALCLPDQYIVSKFLYTYAYHKLTNTRRRTGK